MTLFQKGLVVAGLHCLVVLSLTGRLLYDRTTYPRVWVRTARWDPNLPIRGRYLALQLMPDTADPHYSRTNRQRVLYFVPERSQPFEAGMFGANAPEMWAEVTIPPNGPPRPIRLGVKKDGRINPIEMN